MFDDTFTGNIAFVKVNEKGGARVTKIEGYTGLMMYDRKNDETSVKALHTRYPDLIDIRLD